MSGIITEPMFLEVFPQMEPNNKSGAIQALVVAIYEVGCLLGSMMIVAVGDRLGRRRSVLIGTVIMLIGTAIQASATTLGQMIVGRIVTGWGNGMNTSSIPVWQSEMAPPKIRGFLVLFEGALITGGIMLSYWWVQIAQQTLRPFAYPCAGSTMASGSSLNTAHFNGDSQLPSKRCLESPSLSVSCSIQNHHAG